MKQSLSTTDNNYGNHSNLFSKENYMLLCIFPYSFTDNILSPNPVSDWLISSCRNLILHQKSEINKTHKFLDTKRKKCQKYIKT